MIKPYRGRFAPSPSGPLHLGSMLTAVGSYLQAKHQGGKWLVRIDDLDPPREKPGATDNILRTLEKFGLHWDEEILYQSQRSEFYQHALDNLKEQNLLYACNCSRKSIQDNHAQLGKIGLIYPRTCRLKRDVNWQNAAIRCDVNNHSVDFTDLSQGQFHHSLATDIGDVILKRADGVFAYHIAVVVDDYLQGFSEVVRGFDLLPCTSIQVYLQQCLNYTTPDYAHLPIIVNSQNEKLSKQTGAECIENESTVKLLLRILKALNQEPPIELEQGTKEEVLDWAVIHWDIKAISGQTSIKDHKMRE